MASSRRAQVRTLLAARSGVLVDRAESYLAAVDVWAGQGNAKVVQRVGPGLVAVCCWLAAESLDSNQLARSTAERASGLTPIQFHNAERDLRAAVSNVVRSTASGAPSTPSRRRPDGGATSSPSTSAFSTPSRREAVSRSSASAASTPSSSKRKRDSLSFDPNDRSPEALRAKAQAAQAGTLFQRHTSTHSPPSNVSTPRNVRFQDHFAGKVLHTPTKSSPLKQQRFVSDLQAASRGASSSRGDVAVGSAINGHDHAEGASYHPPDPDGDEAAHPNGTLDPLLLSDAEVRERQRAQRTRSMQNLVTGLVDPTQRRKQLTTTAELEARLELVKQRLAPLLNAEPRAEADSWDNYGSEGDLFIWLPIDPRSL